MRVWRREQAASRMTVETREDAAITSGGITSHVPMWLRFTGHALGDGRLRCRGKDRAVRASQGDSRDVSPLHATA